MSAKSPRNIFRCHQGFCNCQGRVVALIARKNVSLNFLDSLVAALHGIADDSKGIKGMSCNRTKGTYLLTECLSQYAHEELVENLKQSSEFSILCDKATDITMNNFFYVNVRFLNANKEPITRLYRLIPVEEGDATGLFASLESALQKDELHWDKVIGCASDGGESDARNQQLSSDENGKGCTKSVCPKVLLPHFPSCCRTRQ